jgi:uncharacterized protein YaaW (UPF0174 family)
MPKEDRLFDLLNQMTENELKYLMKEILSMDTYVSANKISAEIRAKAGNSFVNLIRDTHELEWKKILIDVADKLNDGFSYTKFEFEDDHSEKEIEDFILNNINNNIKDNWVSFSLDSKILSFDSSIKYYDFVINSLMKNTKIKQAKHVAIQLVKEPLLAFSGTAYIKIIPTVIFILSCHYLKHIKIKMKEAALI